MIPKRESLASEVVNLQLRLIWEPKGLGMDWAWLGAKSKLKKELGALFLNFLVWTKAKSQSAWTVEAPLFVIETSLQADPTRFTTSPLLMVKDIPEAGTV